MRKNYYRAEPVLIPVAPARSPVQSRNTNCSSRFGSTVQVRTPGRLRPRPPAAPEPLCAPAAEEHALLHRWRRTHTCRIVSIPTAAPHSAHAEEPTSLLQLPPVDVT